MAKASMLVLLWTEFETISAQIERLQSARVSAKQRHDTSLVALLSADLDGALSVRESLVARIGATVADPGAIAAATGSRLINVAATSAYLNQPMRSLDEVLQTRGNSKPRIAENTGKTRISIGPSDLVSSLGLAA